MALQKPRRADPVGCILVSCLLSLALLTPLRTAAAEDPPPDPDDTPIQSVGPVTVTATRAERDVLDVAAHVTVIDREDIEHSGVATVPDLLRRVTGVFVTNTTTNPAGFTLDTRGFNNGGGTGTNTLVLVDGRRVNEPDSNFPDWALMPLDEIESIEVVRGPTSAVWGDAAEGGVINIRTRPKEGPPRASLRGYGGTWSTGGGSLRAAASLGSFTGGLFLDGLVTDAYRDQSAYSAQSYRGSLEWNVRDRVLVGVRGGYHYDEREFPGTLTQLQIDMFGRRAANPDNAGDGSEVESGFVQGWLEAVLAEDVELSVRPSWSPRSDRATFSSLSFGEVFVDADKESAGVDVQLRVDRPLFGLANRLIVGGEYLHQTVDRVSNSPSPLDFSTPDPDDLLCSQPRIDTFSHGERDIASGFLQDELQLTHSLLLAAGFRFDSAWLDVAAKNPDPDCGGGDSTEPDYRIWSPRASLTWRVRPDLSIYGAYSRGFRVPTLDESTPLVFPGADVTLPTVAEQTSHAGELGLKYRTERTDFGVAFYYMMVHDEIVFDPSPDPVLFGNRNLDLVRHAGLETSLSFQVLEWLTAYAGYTYDDVVVQQDDELALDGARMPITPRHRGTVGLFVQQRFDVFPRLPFDLEFRANANFVDQRILANDFTQALAPLDPYAVLDLLLTWRPKLGEHVEAAISFAVRNANDEEFSDFGTRFDFNPVTFASEPTAFFYPAATRTFEVGAMITVRR